MRRTGVLALLALGVGASGCESTQEKSARLAKQATGIAKEKQIDLGRANPDVTIEDRAVLHDEYGTAVALRLRSRSKRDQVAVPVTFSLTDGGREVFSNTGAGLAPSLNHVPVLRAGEELWWVNNQVTAEGGKLEAKVGTPPEPAPARLPELEVSGLKLDRDPDGITTVGKVRNRSKIAQTQLVLFAVARKGGKVVAAGRAGIERVKPGASAKFTVFWIGDPRGAKVEVSAPPSAIA